MVGNEVPINEPTKEIIDYTKCDILLQEGKYEDAKKWIDDKIKIINQSNDKFWHYAWYVYIKIGTNLFHKVDPIPEKLKECSWPLKPDQFVNEMKPYFNLVVSAEKSYEKALNFINKHIIQHRNDSDAWNDKGYVLILLKKYHESIDSFNRSVEIDPDNANAWNNKGVALIYSSGDIPRNIAEAKCCFEKAKELLQKDTDPNLASALNNLGILKYRQALKNYNENLDSINAGIEIETDKKNKYAWNYKDSSKERELKLVDVKRNFEENCNESISEFETAWGIWNSMCNIQPKGDTDFLLHLTCILNNKGYVYGLKDENKNAKYTFDDATIFPIADVYRNKGFILNKIARECERQDFDHMDENRKQTDLQEARNSFCEAIKIDPANPLAHNSIGYFLLNLALDNSNSSEQESQRKNMKKVIDHFNKAINHFEIAIMCTKDSNVDFPLALYNAGYAHYLLGKKYQITKLQHDDDKANQQFRFSIECLDAALIADPNFVYAWNTKGAVLNSLGRYHDAVDCFDKALSIRKKTKIFDVEDNESQIGLLDTLFAKGYAFYFLRKNKESNECFNRITKILETIDKKEIHPDAWYYKGNNLFYLEKYEEAVKCFNEVLDILSKKKEQKKPPLFYHSHLSRGQCFYRLGKYLDAIDDFKIAGELEQDKQSDKLDKEFYGQLHNNLGSCYYLNSDFKKAEKEYEKASESHPDLKKIISRAYYNLAVLYNKIKKLEKAKKMLRKSSDKDPDFSEAKNGLRKLESYVPTNNWYDWWFSEGSTKKDILRTGFGIFVLGAIIFFILQIGINLDKEKTNLILDIIFIIALLIAILVLPHLKSFSVGPGTASIELDIEPSAGRKLIEPLEPSINLIKPSMPLQDYPIQHFIAPYYQDPFLIAYSKKSRQFNLHLLLLLWNFVLYL